MELVKDRSKSIKWFGSPVVGAADGVLQDGIVGQCVE